MAQSRDFPDRPFLAASVAVVRDGRVLLASPTAPPFDQVFSFPGGVVEAGESLADAALRELHEETGVTATLAMFLDHVEIVERDPDGRVLRHFVIACFAGHWRGGEGTVGPEAGAIVWATPAEAAALPLTPGLLPMIVRALGAAEPTR